MRVFGAHIGKLARAEGAVRGAVRHEIAHWPRSQRGMGQVPAVVDGAREAAHPVVTAGLTFL